VICPNLQLARILLLGGIAAVNLYSSDGKTAAPSGKPPAIASAKPVQAPGAQQDRALESAIKAKLAKSKIAADGFTVRVQGGVAYWDGVTSVIQHKGTATRMAKTAGARQVVNNIKITDAARKKAADNLDQGRRRVQVKRSEPRTEAGK
jgi:BON domain